MAEREIGHTMMKETTVFSYYLLKESYVVSIWFFLEFVEVYERQDSDNQNQPSLYSMKIFCCVPIRFIFKTFCYMRWIIMEVSPCIPSFGAWQKVNSGSRIPNRLCQIVQLTRVQSVVPKDVAFCGSISEIQETNHRFLVAEHI